MTFRDVRMQGFEKRARLGTVLGWIAGRCRRLSVEAISLSEAAGRVLAGDVVATSDVPSFRRSAMDGFALCGHETVGAGDYSPLQFKIVGTSLPGRPFPGILSSGTAVRIMTGAPVPDGADAVLPAEQALDRGDHVEVTAGVAPGKNVGRIGEDVRSGTTVLPDGRHLRPQDVGLLAALGYETVPVVRRPRVRLIATGNELAPAGQPPAPHQIFDSNSPMLAPLIERDGGLLLERLVLKDDREAIRQALLAHEADVILISGGSSVGLEDHAPSLLAEHGTLDYHGIAMRPASPAGAGTLGRTTVFLLPGNPVSCLCAYDLMAGPAVRRLAGRSPALPYVAQEFRLRRKIVSAVGRLDYCRVQREGDGIIPVAISGASILSSTCRADGFVLVPEESEGCAAGTLARMYWYDPPYEGSADA